VGQESIALNEQQRDAARKRPRRFWLLVLVAGVGLMVAGVAVIAGPLLGVWHRGQADQSALQSWKNGGSSTLVGPVHGGVADVGKSTCGSGSSTDYALVTFTSLAQDHYAGVAGNGTWDLLTQRSMVHYADSPDPGQQGNVIIAFHREPDYEHIDQLNVGDVVTVQDRACRSFRYQVTGRWDLKPQNVTQLGPTSGHDLTLITCDPWWQDYNRLVWRATLVSAPAVGGPGTAPQGTATNPSF
jgi:LPXTG-site transpeptidase (sortase) family protein